MQIVGRWDTSDNGYQYRFNNETATAQPKTPYPLLDTPSDVRRQFASANSVTRGVSTLRVCRSRLRVHADFLNQLVILAVLVGIAVYYAVEPSVWMYYLNINRTGGFHG